MESNQEIIFVMHNQSMFVNKNQQPYNSDNFTNSKTPNGTAGNHCSRSTAVDNTPI